MRDLMQELTMVQRSVADGEVRAWLAAGAPSDDTQPGTDLGLDPR